GDEEEHEGGRHVEDADPLVVGRGQPLGQAGTQPTTRRHDRAAGRHCRQVEGRHGEAPGEADPDGAGPPAAIHAVKAARSTARTVNAIESWWRPQNSAHWPPYTPGAATVKSNVDGWPGIASRLKRNAGT